MRNGLIVMIRIYFIVQLIIRQNCKKAYTEQIINTINIEFDLY